MISQPIPPFTNARPTFGTVPGTSANDFNSGVIGSNQEQLISGSVDLRASGNVTTGAISTGDEEFTDGGTYVDNGSVTIRATDGSISVTTIDTSGSSINLRAGKNISTGALETNSGEFDSLLVASVKLVAEQGDIQVGYIDAGTGGIDIVAARSFRATSATTFRTGGGLGQTPDANSANGDLINVYPSEFFDFLARQGYSKDDVIRADAIRGQPSLNILPRRASLVVRFSGGSGVAMDDVPITIRYGDATRRIIQSVDLPSADGTVIINISGDRFQSFVLAPYKIEFTPDIPPGSDLAGFTFTASEGSVTTFPSNIFPADASGLVAGIVVGTGSNGTFSGSVENILFEGEERPNEKNDLDSVEEQRIGGDIASNTFCEESSSDTLVAPGNLLTVDERLLPEDMGQSISTRGLDFCNQEEAETTIVSDASELGEESEFGNVVEP